MTTTTPEINASAISLRRLLGYLGIALPILLVTVNSGRVESSISHFFYTASGTIFTAILISFALFLFTYKGYDKVAVRPEKPRLWRREWIGENLLTTLGGLFALITALVPTAYGALFEVECTHPLCHNDKTVNLIHLGSAGLFLFIMGAMAIFKFPLGNRVDLNRILHPAYIILGSIVWASLAAMLVYIVMENRGSVNIKNGIFYGEVVAIWAFAAAWLLKGYAQRIQAMTKGDQQRE